MKFAVFISGTGSNFKAIHRSLKHTPAQICCVVSNKPDAKGLEYARDHHIDTLCLPHADYASREAHEQAIISALDDYQPDFVILAGYMRVFTEVFINYYNGRLINIHPSLLPKYKGLHTHQRVLDDYHNGDETQHGCSVHWVSTGVDEGALIAQAALDITPNDTIETLQQRVHTLEHKLYPIVVHQLTTSDTIRYNNSNNYTEPSSPAPLLFNESQLDGHYHDIFERS